MLPRRNFPLSRGPLHRTQHVSPSTLRLIHGYRQIPTVPLLLCVHREACETQNPPADVFSILSFTDIQSHVRRMCSGSLSDIGRHLQRLVYVPLNARQGGKHRIDWSPERKFFFVLFCQGVAFVRRTCSSTVGDVCWRARFCMFHFL